jgi:ketosteroid isomerase-like protein
MNSSAADEIIKLSKQKWDWMSAQDVAPLAALFNEAAVFVHMGATFSKEQELDVIKTGRIHYRDVDIKDVSVRFIGSTAIVLTTLQLGAVVDGNEVSNPFVVTEVYVQQADEWTLASMSFTRLVTHS